MKKTALILALCATTMAWAQQKDTLNITVNNNEMLIYTSDINSLSKTDYNAIIKKITNETQQLTVEFKAEDTRINALVKAEEITQEEATHLRAKNEEELTRKSQMLDEKIEQWAQQYGESLAEDASDTDDWAAQWNSNAQKYESTNPPSTRPTDTTIGESSTIIINDDGVTIESASEDWDSGKLDEAREKYKRNKTIGYFNWHFGWNNFVNADGIAQLDDQNAQSTELNFWPSMVWGFGFGGKTRFGSSKMYVRYGAEFNWHFFQLKGDNVIQKVEPTLISDYNGIQFVQDASKNYAKSSFRMVYVDAPVLLEFDASKPGRSNGFSLAVGGYAGLRLNAHTKVKYSDFNDDKTEAKVHNNFYTNGFRYGLIGQVGVGTFKITAKYDLNELFVDNRDTPDYQIASLTLGWVFP